MARLAQWRLITKELATHIPFTAFGALTGIIFMVIIFWGGFLDPIYNASETVFYVLHPTHVFLSALVTTAIYRLYGNSKLWAAILIGYTGAIGIATLSDSIVPYLGESLAVLPGRELHIGFIEEPWLTNPPALAGIAIGYWRPITKFPHAGHVLISTWASLFHIIMASLGESVNWIQLIAIFSFLFIAVWIPCCLSDIVYPLLFVKGAKSHNHH
ncbi:MAG: hypothetical protein KAW13_01790 [Dehalococcoidia bacterium]|nr:hypothetical protein [Dehalococcoidia bacterium]